MEHSKTYSLSASARWRSCTASPQAIADFGLPDQESEAAAEGTLAHSVVESVINGEPPPEGATEEMLEAGQLMVDVINHLAHEYRDLHVYIEQRVHLAKMHEEMFGTADVIAYSQQSNALFVIDFKFGRIHVDPVENSQMLCYMLGAHTFLNLSAVADIQQVIIVQPRTAPAVRPWDVPPNYLIHEFAPTLKQAVADIESGNTKFHVSESNCRFCPALAKCPEAKKVGEAAISGMLGIDKDIAEAMDNIPILKQWIAAVEKYAQHTLQDGGTVPGYKLVEGRSNRRWKDQEQVLKWLKGKYALADIREPVKLLSPAKMEKLLKPKHLTQMPDFISRPKGKTTVAKSSDKRPAIEPMFNDISGE